MHRSSVAFLGFLSEIRIFVCHKSISFPFFRLLGHLYSAEALILSNKISEAIEHLNPSLIQDVSVAFPANSEPEKKDRDDEREGASQATAPLRAWSPTKLGTARAVMEYNLSVAFAIRGEYEKAGETLKGVYNSRGPNCEVPAHVMMLVMYLELQLGKFHRILHKFKNVVP